MMQNPVMDKVIQVTSAMLDMKKLDIPQLQ